MEDVLYLVIPAYNEEANIRDTIEMWYPVVEQANGGGRSRLLIIDDGSRDRTAEIFVDGRSCQTGEMLIDSTGVLTGVVIGSLIFREKEKRIQDSQETV